MTVTDSCLCNRRGDMKQGIQTKDVENDKEVIVSREESRGIENREEN
jgi:hypothetical protein